MKIKRDNPTIFIPKFQSQVTLKSTVLIASIHNTLTSYVIHEFTISCVCVCVRVCVCVYLLGRQNFLSVGLSKTFILESMPPPELSLFLDDYLCKQPVRPFLLVSISREMKVEVCIILKSFIAYHQIDLRINMILFAKKVLTMLKTKFNVKLT